MYTQFYGRFKYLIRRTLGLILTETLSSLRMDISLENQVRVLYFKIVSDSIHWFFVVVVVVFVAN